MKYKKISIVWILTLLFFCMSCEKSANSNSLDKDSLNTQSEEHKLNYKVTFIELGSLSCIPCKMMQPIMEEIEKEYQDKVRIIFYDVRTQDGYDYAQKYKIRVIPTQIFLDKDGNEYFRHEGFFPKEELVKILKQKIVE